MVWRRFTCIQPTFDGKSVAGPDLVFRVQPTGRRSLHLVDKRCTRTGVRRHVMTPRGRLLVCLLAGPRLQRSARSLLASW
jgi:hypothetical protein